MEKDTEQKVEKSDVALKEEKILKFWQENNTFKKSIEKDAPNGNFVFYDGPPYATGLPHYGHLLAGIIKDIIPRYQTMRGKRVLRRWGWDCHGLPIENLVEQELGLQSKKDIEIYGVEKFNAKARSIVFRYADEWKKIIPRSGRWIDMDNDYRTMDPTFTESVWWSFKTLYEKNLMYTAFKSMHICPHCETTLSNFEINQGYKDITDISVFVKFKLLPDQKFGENGEFVTGQSAYILSWTTTPWSLPGNVALAVNNDITYSAVRIDGVKELLILSNDVLEKVMEGHQVELVHTLKGSGLVGLAYVPIFDYYNNDKLENRENAWKVYAGDFVTTDEGTGIVHIAPAFGEEDMNLGKENNLPFIQHVLKDGTFTSEVTDFAGQKVKPKDDHQKTDIEIIKYLASKGSLFAKKKIIHSYPHCWRCDTPLLNYATTSWFLKVTQIKDQMVELNKKVVWTPEGVGEGRFGKWLEGARDWAISRTRYWGAPLPVWENKNERVVIGSIDELKDHIGRRNKYFFVRHGESECNVNGDMICSKDINASPLTSLGREEVAKSAETLNSEKIDVIITSPFLRTKQTAGIIAEKIGISNSSIIVDERLSEINAGEFDGISWDKFTAKFNSIEDRFNTSISGSEKWADIFTRVMECMYDLDKKYNGKNIVVVGHGGPLNLGMLGAKGWSMKEIMKRYYDDGFYNAEIKECDFVALPHRETFEIDLHRPYIDEVVLKGTDGTPLTRVSEVFDVWYDSGSMAFAQQHYPFENKDSFEKENSPLFPADFIAEGQDQTRGWFYTSLVLSTALFGKSPYNHVVVNGLVLAEDGRKMSKKLKNYPDPNYIMDKYGADALRYYMVSSPIVRAEDLYFSEKGVDEIYKKIVQKVYNVLSFYEMYGTSVSDKKDFKQNILDTWITVRLNELLEVVTKNLDTYQLDKASRPIVDFVEDLSTWYLRRSRDRFKSDNLAEREAVSYYTRSILEELSKIIAPFMPFLAEEVYSRVKAKDASESVHFEKWPEISKEKINADLLEQMTIVRNIVTSALELRQKSNLKVRQPLSSLKIKNQNGKLEQELLDIIKDEINVKEIIFDQNIQTDFELDVILTPELVSEGVSREIMRFIQDIRKKENLNPKDQVSIVICTDDFIKNILSSFKSQIKTTTGVSEISYSSELQKHAGEIDGHSILLSLNI